ncbi:MAG: 16S rRNA (guanine(527)-N(7))-methyltransferase RsmG [Candidatus Cloacimonadota bacterium]|nr:MAG: 16S rRNA (guanine(527)-N(7))-methyltransferase RsmG [Candidatus Cloacimonadota bacterium]
MFHVKHRICNRKEMKKKEFVEALIKKAEQYEIEMKRKEADYIYVYYKELFMWNKKVNLISKKEENRFIERHIIDSLSILKKIRIENDDRLLDIGSGNGLPGIPLAIMLPNRTVDLLESNTKKCVFLRHLISKLNLKKTTVFCERFEKIYQKLNKYDYVLVRGKKISEREKGMIMDCLRSNGSLITYAGIKPYSLEVKSREQVECFEGIEKRKLIIIRHF